MLEVPDWNENHHGAGKGAEQDLYSFSDVALVRLGIRLLGYDDKHKLGAILASGVGKREKHSSKLFSPLQQTNQCTHIISIIIIHYGSILWHDVGKNPILVGYVVLGIGYGVSAHDLSGYKVLGVLVVDNGPHVKEPLTALLKPIPKS